MVSLDKRDSDRFISLSPSFPPPSPYPLPTTQIKIPVQ